MPISRRPRKLALPRSARLLPRLVTLLPIVGFLLAATLYCVKLGRVLDANLPAVASREAGTYLHRQVRIHTIHLSPLALTVTGLAVSNKETFAASHGEALASAQQIVVHYSLHDLLFDSKNAAHAIGDIDLTRPTALVEVLPGKRFNFSDLLNPKKKPAQRPYDGRILVTDGFVTLRDYTAPANAALRPAVNTLKNINTTVDLRSERYVYFSGTAQGDGKRVADVAAIGDASRKTAGRFRASVQVSDADAAYWSTYFKAVPNLRVLSGRARADITVARLGSKPAPGLPVDLFGRVFVRNGAVGLTDPRVSRLPLQHVTGDATFTGASVTLSGSARAGGQAVRFAGTIADFVDPQVAFAGAADNLDALRLASYFPQLNLPPGLSAAPASARVRVTGSAKDPVWGVDAAVPALHLQGQTARNVQAHAVFAGGILSLSNVAFSIGGGSGKLRATVNTTALPSPLLLLGGRVDNVNLTQLPLPKTLGKPTTLAGKADAAFFVTGTTQKPSVVANVHVLNPKVAQTAFQSLKGRVSWQFGQPVVVRRALLDDGRGGVLLASGMVPLPGTGKNWNLALSAAGADIHKLLAPYLKAGPKPVSVGGVAYAQARVTGPLAKPALAGDVQIYGGQFNSITADAVTGHVATNGSTLKLTAVTVRRFPEELALSGTVGDLRSGNPALSLTASVPEADVTDLLGLARQAVGKAPLAALPTATGAVSAQVQIGGRVRSPRVSGHAELTDATIGAYRIAQARADAAWDGTTVRVSGLTVREQETGAALSGHGLWNTKSGTIAAAMSAADVNLSLLRPYTTAYADLRGTLSGSISARGTVRSPVADVRIAGQDLTVDGQNLAPLTLAGTYAAGAFTKTAAPWTLTFLPEGGGPVSYVVDALRVALPSPQDPKRPVALAVRAHLPEDAAERISHLLDTVRDSRFASRPAVQNFLAQIDALPSPPTGTLWIPTLTARGPLSAPAVSADLRAQNLALGTDHLQSLTASVTYAGGASPDVQADLSASQLSASGIAIDTISANGGYSNRTVTVDALDARSQSAYLHGAGRADLDGKTDASLDVSDVPLSLFSPFVQTPGTPHRTLSGTVSALTMQASGRTNAPELVASVTLSKPGLETAASTPGGEPTRFTLDLIRSGAITLAAPAPGTNNRVLSVADLAAFKAGRQIASVSGSVPLSLGEQTASLPSGEPLSATARVSDLSVLAVFAPAVVDPARTGGALSATVSSGKNGQLQGTVDITNGALGLVGFDTGLKNVTGRVLLSGGHVQVQKLVLPSTRDGQITVSGGGTLGGNGNLNLQVTAQKFAVDETGKNSFLARTYGSGGSGILGGQVSVTGPFLSPLIATPPDAPLIVSKASVSLPTVSPPAGGTKTASAFNPRFDINVLLGGAKNGTVSARSSLLRADARGDLLLSGSLQTPVLRSHLTVARGQFFLPPSTTLKVVRPVSEQDNTVDLRYDAANPVVGPDGTAGPELETRVDLTAQANVSVSDAARALGSSALGGSGGIGAPSQETLSGGTAAQQTAANGSSQKQRYTITAHITGLLNVPDKLTLDLTSSPPGLSRSQMLAALVQEDVYGSLLAGGQGAEGAVKTQIGQAFYAAGVTSLLFPIENTVIDTFGLTDFSVNYTPDAPTLVSLSKELAPRLLATYTRLVGTRTSGPISTTTAPPQYTLKLSYGLAGHLQFSVSTNDQRDNTIALEGLFGF